MPSLWPTNVKINSFTLCNLWIIESTFLPAVESGTLIPEARATVETINKKT